MAAAAVATELRKNRHNLVFEINRHGLREALHIHGHLRRLTRRRCGDDLRLAIFLLAVGALLCLLAALLVLFVTFLPFRELLA